jgi:hypothetical protein
MKAGWTGTFDRLDDYLAKGLSLVASYDHAFNGAPNASEPLSYVQRQLRRGV